MDEDEFTLPALLVTDHIIQGLQSGSILASEAGATLPGVNEENQLSFLTQLCDAYIEKKLDADQVLAAIAAAGLTQQDVGADLAEALWYATIQVSSRAVKGDKDTYDHLAELARELLKKGKVTRAQLLAVGEAELLDALGLTKIAMSARDKRTLTSMYYKQDKYNLLREQNEGYGKLVAELLSGGPLQPEHLPALQQQIKSHIGTFNLDPNRVCDLVLDAAEAELALFLADPGSADKQEQQQGAAPVPVWLELMSMFSNDAPMLMLARKFLHYQADRPKITGEETEDELAGPPPNSLFLLAACMIKAGQVALEQVLPYLGPTDELRESFNKAHKALREEVAGILLSNLEAEGDSVATRRMEALAKGGLDAVAKARGISNRADDDGGGYDRRGGGGMGPPGGGGMGPPQHRGMAGGMQGFPQGMNGGAWQRGMTPGQPGMGAGQFGGYPAGPHGGGMSGYGMGPGHFPGGSGGMGGPGMGGGGAMAQAGAASGGARGSGGGQAAQPAAAAAAVQETRHNIMPAQDLVLDARQWDRQLLDPSCGQLQLLRALMQVDAWEAAGLMLQWLQDVIGVDAASDRAIAAALGRRIKQLLQPVHTRLYPQGPSNANLLEKLAERPSSARDKDREAKLLVFSPEQRAAQPFGPAMDPAAYQLVTFLGPYIYRDAVLMVMLLKVLRHELLFYAGMLQGRANMETLDKVCDVLSGAVLPGLTQHYSNMGLANMIWDVMAHMPFPYRAEVYRKSLLVVAAKPVAAAAANMAVKAFKRWKGRIALPDKKDIKVYKSVVRGQQHLIAKVTHASPLQVCDEIVKWAMTTPTQVETLSEVVKMHNRLSSDALTYTALFLWDRLGYPKIKADGTSEADFVPGLSDLVGRAALAHPWSSLDVGVVLGYLTSCLHDGDSVAILLLKKLVGWMSGIDGPQGADPCNFLTLCLGPALTAYKKRDDKREEQVRIDKLQAKGRRVLAQLLTSPRDQPQQQLLVPLIVSMSQHLDWTMYTTHTTHVKEVAEMYDKVSHATQQYLMLLEQFLRDEELTLKDLAGRLPPLHELIREYKVAPGIAWSLWRPICKALEPALAATLVKQQEEASPAALEWAAAASGDTAAAAGGAGGGGGGGDGGEEGEVEEGEAMQGQEGPGAAQAPEILAAAEKAAADQGLPVDVPSLLGSVEALGPDMFEHLSPQLYMAFWSLELKDMYFPADEYRENLATVDSALAKYPDEVRANKARVRDLQSALKSRPFVDDRLAKDLEGATIILDGNSRLLEAAQAFEKPLRQERDAAAARHSLAMKRLQAEKHLYVKDAKGIHVKLHAFIKHCLLPRLTRSAADAVYCHVFCLKLHELDVPNWPAGFFWDDAMVSLTNIIPTVTEKEAGYLAMFLGLALLKIQEWYADSRLYKAECDQQTMRQSNVATNRLSWEQFRKLFKKWQNGLQKSLMACLADPEQYYQRRNAIIIIAKLAQADPRSTAPPMFPYYKSHFEELTKVLTDIGATEKRPDLAYMAKNTNVHLTPKGVNCKDMPGLAYLGGKPGGRGPAAAAAGGGGGGGPNRPAASPGRPQQQQQQQQRGGGGGGGGGAGSRPATPPLAAAPAGGGGGGSTAGASGAAGAAAAAAGAGGQERPKAKPRQAAAGSANVLKKAFQDVAADMQGTGAAAAAGSKHSARPASGAAADAAAVEDEPPTKRARTSAGPGKGDGGGPSSTAAASAGAGGGGERERGADGRGEDGRGGGEGGSSRQQQQQGGGRQSSSRPPTGSDRVTAVAAAERGGGGGSSSRAASPGSNAASPARGGGGAAAAAGDRQGGSRMGAHHSRGDHHSSRDLTPQRHGGGGGGHSDEPQHGSKEGSKRERSRDRDRGTGGLGEQQHPRGDGQQHRSHDGAERGEGGHGSSRGDRGAGAAGGGRDGSRSRQQHHSPDRDSSHKGRGAGGSAAGGAAADEGGKDSGQKEKKRSSKSRKGDKGDKGEGGGKKEGRAADETREETSHDSKRRRYNEAAAAADGASSREQRQQQHGSNDGGGRGDRGGRDGGATGGGDATNGHRSGADAAAGGGGGGREGRGDRQDGDRREKRGDGGQQQQQSSRHTRISFPGAEEGGGGGGGGKGGGSEKPAGSRPSSRKR